MKKLNSFLVATNPYPAISGASNRRTLGFGCALVLILPMAGGCKKPAPATSESLATSSAGVAPAASGGQAQSGGSLAERLKAIQSGQGDNVAKAPLPAWKPFQPGATAPTIPLGKGLVVVTAVSQPQGDYESIKSILDVSSTAVRLAYSAELPPEKVNTTPGAAQAVDAAPSSKDPRRVSGLRVIDVADLQKAHGYAYAFAEKKEEHFPGTTAISTSTEILSQLHTGNPVEFHFLADATSSLMDLGAQVLGQKIDRPTITQYAGMPMYACNLHQVEPTDLAIPVLLNDQRVDLPAVHAMCSMGGNEEAHFYYLDQPSNPITLAFQLGSIDSRLQVIKITLPPPEEQKAPSTAVGGGGGSGAGGGGSQMEQALAVKKPVEIYGIYFDFNKATIKPESEVVLQQIAGILQKNPDWKLNVGGHTDNIGEDNFNLSLSQRRSAAVKDALVTRYKIAPDRLATSGYGASMPIETNKTIEGRARNRRVELQRQ